jgi:hypothetical protein
MMFSHTTILSAECSTSGQCNPPRLGRRFGPLLQLIEDALQPPSKAALR